MKVLSLVPRIFILIVLLLRPVLAQAITLSPHALTAPYLVKTITPGTQSSNFNVPIYVVGSRAFFVVNNPNPVLWQTDGTRQNTQPVQWNIPSDPPLDPRPVGAIGNRLLVNRNLSSELWVTDGTSAGSKRLRSDLAANQLFTLNDRYYFTSYTSNDLWQINGDAISSSMVFTSSSFVSTLILDNWLYYINDAYELWRTDGSITGTQFIHLFTPFTSTETLLQPQVACCPIPPPAITPKLIVLNNTLYVRYQNQLWKTDGTPSKTVLVANTLGNEFDRDQQNPVSSNGTLYFLGLSLEYGYELFASDGTTTGTRFVKDIFPGLSPSSISSITPTSFGIAFIATDGIHGQELWKSDGTPDGTQMISDIASGDNISSNINNLRFIDGKLIFAATDGIHGGQLWTSDGTLTGTHILIDLEKTITVAPDPNQITAFNGKFLFSANDPIYGRELWLSDGTSAGTQLIRDVYSMPNSTEMQFIPSHLGRLIFQVNDRPKNYSAIWASDGTNSGTQQLYPIHDGDSAASLDYIGEYDGYAYFIDRLQVVSSNNRSALWRTNGTVSGTTVLTENVGNLLGIPIILGDHQLLFASSLDKSLWQIDLNNPSVVNHIATFSGFLELINRNDHLWINEYDHDTRRIWHWSSSQGLSLIQVTSTYLPTTDFAVIGQNTLIFNASASSDAQILKSNGTTSETIALTSTTGTLPATTAQVIATSPNYVYFMVLPNGQPQLWRTDGTTTNTVLITTNLTMEPLITSVFAGVVSGKFVFASRNDQNPAGRDVSLWAISDTPDVANINQLASSLPSYTINTSYIASVQKDDVMYLTANQEELWRTDGTPAGTKLIKAATPYSLVLGEFAGDSFLFELDNGPESKKRTQ